MGAVLYQLWVLSFRVIECVFRNHVGRSKPPRWVGVTSNLLKVIGPALILNVEMSILHGDLAAIDVVLRRKRRKPRNRELRLEPRLLRSPKVCSLRMTGSALSVEM